MIVESCNNWMEQYVRECGAVAGSVHMRKNDGLQLVAAVEIPGKVQQVVERISSSKGIAGQAVVQGEGALTCNLLDGRFANHDIPFGSERK